MAIDRAPVLRNAEKLVREGKLESAIAEYLRVAEVHPNDWTTANTLGDLYARVGQPDKAVEQFARVAASLSREGFLSKAAAVYKKIIKIRPDDEYALLQSGEIAATQGVLVEARAYLNTVAERRMARGDRSGVADIRIRLGSLDPTDFEARRQAAYARIEKDDKPGALRDFRAIAADFVEKGRLADAIEVLGEAAGLDPGSDDVRRELFAAHVAAGDLQRAREYASTPDLMQMLAQAYTAAGDTTAAAEFLTVDTDSGDLDVLLQVADKKLRGDAVEEGLGILRQLLNQDPTRAEAITLLGWELGRAKPDVGFRVVDMAAETAVIEANWPAAAAALQEFIARVPNHIPALSRLAEICFEGGLTSTFRAAQAQLADASPSAGVADEVPVMAEDLTSESAPLSSVSTSSSPDPLLLASELPVDGVSELEQHSFDLSGTTGDLESIFEEVNQAPATASPDNDEVDLTDMLDGFKVNNPGPVEVLTDRDGSPGGRNIDEVLEHFRDDAGRRSRNADAEHEYARGIALLEAGRIDEGVQALEAASRAPMQRFRAASALGRLHRNRAAVHEAIEWFERAAETPAPTADEAHGLLYELAASLESVGELERALAVCLELRTEAGEYRDVTARINRLTQAQARG